MFIFNICLPPPNLCLFAEYLVQVAEFSIRVFKWCIYFMHLCTDVLSEATEHFWTRLNCFLKLGWICIQHFNSFRIFGLS